jgi:S1-C subfamily serine protease
MDSRRSLIRTLVRPLRGCLFGALLASAAATAATAADSSQAATPSIDEQAFFGAIVTVQTRALPDARSAATLGAVREGTGVVIGKGGLILTIGYLIIEADDVKVTDGEGHVHPARVVAYDHGTGLGLVQPIAPFDVTPLQLGDSGKLAESDPVLIVTHGGPDEATRAVVVSRRPFTGSWEYLLDRAIFTAPATSNWSGAALIGTDGSLLGVGSLIVRDASEVNPHVPGNMFVPIDALKPILADLIRTGRRAGPARPWLGLSADEIQGRLVVDRVSPEGPADRAGVQSGDIILAVAGEGVRSQAEFYHKIWGRGAAGSEIPLRVLQGIDIHEIKVRSIDRTDYFRQKPTY